MSATFTAKFVQEIEVTVKVTGLVGTYEELDAEVKEVLDSAIECFVTSDWPKEVDLPDGARVSLEVSEEFNAGWERDWGYEA